MSFDVKVLNDHLDVIKIDYQAQTVSLNGKSNSLWSSQPKLSLQSLKSLEGTEGTRITRILGHQKDCVTQN